MNFKNIIIDLFTSGIEYCKNIFLHFFIIYLKMYSFVEIKIMLCLDYIYDYYYLDYYKVNIFCNNTIVNKYMYNDLNIIDLTNTKYDILIIQDYNKKCLIVDESMITHGFDMNIKKGLITENNSYSLFSFRDKLFIPCNYNFTLIVILINNKEYEIKLSNCNYNYYLVKNKINYNFIKYYAFKYLKLKDSFANYDMTIVDNKTNIINNLTKLDTIVFHLNEYEIIKDNILK